MLSSSYSQVAEALHLQYLYSPAPHSACFELASSHLVACAKNCSMTLGHLLSYPGYASLSMVRNEADEK